MTKPCFSVPLQKRNFLLLRENDGAWGAARRALKSPLGLAIELIRRLNESRFEDLADQLDTIKQFVAGVERARSLQDYGLARFYPSMFAFHQFFNSSFRARQGKVLEAVLKGVLKSACPQVQVPGTSAEMHRLIRELLGVETRLDIDLLAKYEHKRSRLLIAQIRSRDDTGGTTAKGSLVDLLKVLLEEGGSANCEVTYLVGIWDKRGSQQKESTISKVFASLKQYSELSKEEFSAEIKSGGVLVGGRDKENVGGNFFLRLAYGVEEIASALAEFCGEEEGIKMRSAIEQAIEDFTNWDDLWVAYAVSTLEMENYLLHGVSNMEILKTWLDEKGIIALDKGFDEEKIDRLAIALAFEWQWPALPLESVSDQVHYLRDLLYLRLIYNRLFV